MKYHHFFGKISSQAVKLMMKNWHLIKLNQDQLLYKEHDTPLGFYLVIFGKLVMHSKSLGAIGMCSSGDFIGEELIFERPPEAKSIAALAEKPKYFRTETAYSEGDTYLLECYFDDWPKLRDMLVLMKLRKDYLLIDNHLKRCYYQKRAWRAMKSKMTGQMYNIEPRKIKGRTLIAESPSGSLKPSEAESPGQGILPIIQQEEENFRNAT